MALDRELLNQILILMREKKKQVEMATITGKHRNTIWKYVKHIRSKQVYEDHLTINKIDNRLSDEINSMSVPSLLSWRGQLVPKRIETKGELTVHKEVPSLDIHKFNDNEVAEIRRVARRIHASRDAGEK